MIYTFKVSRNTKRTEFVVFFDVNNSTEFTLKVLIKAVVIGYF